MKSKKPIIAAVLILILLASVFGIVYSVNGPKTSEGAKAIVIEVTGEDGEGTGYHVQTDAEYLKQAMDELAAREDLDFSYQGSEGEYGLMVEVINRERAVYDKDGAYWALYVNGEYGQYGADSQPVEDGSTYSWVREAAQ